MHEEESYELRPEPGMRYDLYSTELQAYLGRFRQNVIPCPICKTDKWGTIESQFSNKEFKNIPDSITVAEFEAEIDPAVRELKCSFGNYNFICGGCGFCLPFSALFVVNQLQAQPGTNSGEKISDE